MTDGIVRTTDAGAPGAVDPRGPGLRQVGDPGVFPAGAVAGGGDRTGAAGDMVGHDCAAGVVTRPARTIRFTVPGNPVGKGRPRVATRGRFTQLYTPEKTASYESLVKLAAHRAMEGRPLVLDAVEVVLFIRVPIPASWSQKKRALAVAGHVLPTTKPDIDNVEKAIFDGINGVVWKDDVQVVGVTKCKRYSEAPCVQVEISPAAR